MTQEVILYIVLLTFLNFCCPLMFYRKSKKWEMALIAGALLWFIEAFMIAQGTERGVGYDPVVKAFSFSTYVPIPFILGAIGMLVLMYKQLTAVEEDVDVIDVH